MSELSTPADIANSAQGDSKNNTAPDWKKVAARRRHEINSKIPEKYHVPPALLKPTNLSNLVQTCGILTARELSIVNSTAVKLLHLVHSQKLTAVEVTTAFCKSAAIAHQAVYKALGTRLSIC